MKIIYKSFFSDKLIFRQLIILLCLFVILYVNVSFKGFVDNIILNSKNELYNRTIEIILNKEYSIDVIQDEFIEKIELMENNRYRIILKDFSDIDIFISKYSNYCVNITSNNNQLGISNILSFCQSFLDITLIILFFVILIIIIINIFEILLSEKQVISFYKLIGFSNLLIIKYFFLTFSLVYFIIFIFSVIIYSCIILFLNFILSFELTLVSFSFFIVFYLSILLLIFALLVFLYFKIKKITPMYFQLTVD